MKVYQFNKCWATGYRYAMMLNCWLTITSHHNMIGISIAERGTVFCQVLPRIWSSAKLVHQVQGCKKNVVCWCLCKKYIKHLPFPRSSGSACTTTALPNMECGPLSGIYKLKTRKSIQIQGKNFMKPWIGELKGEL